MTLHTIQRALADAGCEPLTVAQKHALSRVLEPEPVEASLERIAYVVCCEWHISLAEFRGKTRTKSIGDARHAFVYMACHRTSKSMAEVARYYGRTTGAAVHSLSAANDLLATDRAFKLKVNAALARLWRGE